MQVIYTDFPDTAASPSLHGIALIAAIAGMFGFELIGTAEKRAKPFLDNETEPEEAK